MGKASKLFKFKDKKQKKKAETSLDKCRKTIRTKKTIPGVKKEKCMWFRTCEYAIVLPMTLMNLFLTYVLLLFVVQFHWWGLDSTDYPTRDQLGLAEAGTYENDIVVRRHRLSNQHFVLMPFGLYLLTGISILIFRFCCCYSRMTVKIIHMLLHLPAIPTTIIGYIRIGDFHKHIETPYDTRFYGFHSWLAIIVMMLHLYQLISGIIVFLVLPAFIPMKTLRFRALYTPYHIFFGMAEFFFAVQVFATGFCDAGLHLSQWEGYPRFATNTFEFDLYLRRMPSMRAVIGLLTLSCVLVFHSLIRDDFRHRGRILMTTDPNYQST